MSTQTWSNFWDMTSDVGFRVIGLAMSTALQALNPSILTKTTDTGQINWVTVTKPVAINTAAGYEIYQFTDSIGTLFYKIEYGTANPVTAWSTWITVGTGSNGSGTITGIQVARTQCSGAAASSLVTNFSSYACCINGALWFDLGVGAQGGVNGTGEGLSGHLRTCDSAGGLTGDGYFAFISSTAAANTTAFAVNIGSGVVVSNGTGQWSMIPFGITNSIYTNSGTPTNQTWRFEIPLPQTLTTALGSSYIVGEAGAATTNNFPIVGATTHTFFFTGTSNLRAAQASSNSGWCLVYE